MESGVPSPVPEWYKYSTVTMGPRKIGYYHCCNTNCLHTEDFDTRFQMCAQCQLAQYCSRECQNEDWKAKHKKVCKKAAERREQMSKMGKMFQKLSDMSLTGQGGSLEEMIANASTNEAVKPL